QERNYWDIEELREHIELTYQVNYKDEESYYDLLKAAGLSWKKSQKSNPKKDPAQVSLKKLEITNQIAAWQGEIDSGQRSVFMTDECHLVWGDTCGYIWGKTNERIEVPMTNERERQTYYGALDYSSKEFIVKAYATGNSENTVDFLKYLQSLRPNQKISVIWDGASYHKYKAMPKYLESINAGKPP
ncbi:MAG: IS630 family transposase, partial [Pseudanabaena sp.]